MFIRHEKRGGWHQNEFQAAIDGIERNIAFLNENKSGGKKMNRGVREETR